MTTIVIPIFEGVTQLDFTAPHQFLSVTPGFNVVVASMGGMQISSNGLTFADLQDLNVIERCDVLCIPGGVGCVGAIEDQAFLSTIRRLAGTAQYLTSVCTGSIILAAAGLLEGRRAACLWYWRDMLTDFGAIPDNGRVVRDGNIITGGGVTAGIDFALTLISELCGSEVAQAIQLRLEYAPAPPFNSGLPEIAPAAILNAVTAAMADSLAANRKRVSLVASRLQVEKSTQRDGF